MLRRLRMRADRKDHSVLIRHFTDGDTAFQRRNMSEFAERYLPLIMCFFFILKVKIGTDFKSYPWSHMILPVIHERNVKSLVFPNLGVSKQVQRGKWGSPRSDGRHTPVPHPHPYKLTPSRCCSAVHVPPALNLGSWRWNGYFMYSDGTFGGMVFIHKFTQGTQTGKLCEPGVFSNCEWEVWPWEGNPHERVCNSALGRKDQIIPFSF